MLDITVRWPGESTSKKGVVRQRPGAWSNEQKALALPVIETARTLARAMKLRITSGRGPRGSWASYRSRGPDQRFWVPPGRPQPRPDFIVKAGKWAGWAVYSDHDAYLAATGDRGKPVDFDQSGQLWSKFEVVPKKLTHATLTFRGSHKTGSGKPQRAAEMAGRNAANQRHPLLQPSPEEIEDVNEILAEEAMTRLVEWATGDVGKASQNSLNLNKKLRSVQRRSAKLGL